MVLIPAHIVIKPTTVLMVIIESKARMDTAANSLYECIMVWLVCTV